MSNLRKRRTIALAASVLGFAVAIFIALVPLVTSRVHVREGEIAARTIRAPRDISFISDALTQRRQDEAAAAVPDSQIFDPSIASSQQAQLNTMLGRIRAVVGEDTNATPDSRQQALQRIDKLTLSPTSLGRLQAIQPSDFDAIDVESRSALARVFDASLPPSATQSIREQASTYVASGFDRDASTLNRRHHSSLYRLKPCRRRGRYQGV